jgi:hypothetical protein
MQIKRCIPALLFFAAALTPIFGQATQPRLEEITLFTSGVAEFHYVTTVFGNDTIQLSVPENQMSDVVRSLTVSDPRGRTTQIDYAGQASLARRTAEYRFDLSRVAGLSDLLAQAPGAEVEVSAQGTDYRGTLVGVEAGDGEHTTMTLRTATGLVSLSMSTLGELRFTDQELQADLDAALAVLGELTATPSRRQIDVILNGEGRREVSLRYLREMPVWKTSYRAVLSGDELVLQGWAHVDNTSGIDWDSVQLSLVSAAPDTYFFDLYPPRYVSRRSAPVTSGMARSESMALRTADELGAAPPRAQAQVDRTGLTFHVDDPVSLSRGASAMIPLIAERLPAQAVRRYDPRVDARHPRYAITVTNPADQPLPSGPITVYAQNRYVGDAVLPVTAPEQSHTLRYATDLTTTVSRNQTPAPEELRSLTVVDGILVAERRGRTTTQYRVDGPTQDLVIVHYPRSGWNIVSPAASAEAMAAEFPVVGSSLTVVEEQVQEQRYALLSMDAGTIAEFQQSGVPDQQTLRVLETVGALRRDIATAEREYQNLSTERREIVADQQRLRENMMALERDSSLYRRYLRQLEEQETELERLAEALDDAEADLSNARQSLSTYLRSR